METTRLLTARLAELLRREQSALVDFLAELSRFDAERRWEDLGYSSLFDFLHRELGLSRGAAFYRSTAARLVREYPEVGEALADGRLCLMTVGELAKVITPGNRADVLPRFLHASRREAQAIAAELRPSPAPPVREVVTLLAPALPAPSLALSPVPDGDPERVFPPTTSTTSQEVRFVLPVGRSGSELASPASPANPDTDVQPLTADLRRLHLTVSKAFLAKLDAARDALSHARPGASTEEILAAGLDLVLAARDRRKGVVARPRTSADETDPDAEAIPAAVRREVWARDGGRCQFPLASGGVCGSTFQVEFDHVKPRALGGPSTVANLRLACKPHNLMAARRRLGERRAAFRRRGKKG